MMKRLTMSLIGIGCATAALAQPADDPLLRPIAPDSSARWLKPQPPTRIFGNSYLVGFEGLNVGLIRTNAGLILIDGAVPQAVPAIEANIRKLGFRLRDIRFILSTEPHFDHASGMAALARDSGATVVASAAAAPVLRAGHSGPEDPQMAWLPPFPAIRAVRIMRPGETLTLGGVSVKAIATPGHTPGSMSWTWRSCEGRRCANVVFASSLNPIAADGWRFTDPAHRAVIAQFRQSIRTMRALPCDILLSAHPDQSGGDIKFARLQKGSAPNPFLDPGACRAYAANAEANLDKRLTGEKAAPGR